MEVFYEPGIEGPTSLSITFHPLEIRHTAKPNCKRFSSLAKSLGNLVVRQQSLPHKV